MSKSKNKFCLIEKKEGKLWYFNGLETSAYYRDEYILKKDESSFRYWKRTNESQAKEH
jgi:hypothetical protein